MSLEDFRKSLSQSQPPSALHPLLKALWFDARGNWNAAHELAQEIETSDGSWVHAYLHRKEGDESNAGYWYHKAGRSHSRVALEKEWEEIVRALL